MFPHHPLSSTPPSDSHSDLCLLSLHQCQHEEAELGHRLAVIERRKVPVHLPVILGDVQTVQLWRVSDGREGYPGVTVSVVK